jgi:formylglycine-generating enzyme required for sulfatase activity
MSTAHHQCQAATAGLPPASRHRLPARRHLRWGYAQAMLTLLTLCLTALATDAEEIDLRGATYVLVSLPPGDDMVGSPLTEDGRVAGLEDQHKVLFRRGHWMGTTEVTQGFYEAVMGENPVAVRAARSATTPQRPGPACAEWGVDPDLPVFCVDLADAVAFCNKLSELRGLTPAYATVDGVIEWDPRADGYRLPTADEWEYAARAGTDGRWASGDDPAKVCGQANVADAGGDPPIGLRAGEPFPCDDGFRGLAPVSSLAPNAWGLYDMTGNVSEWVWPAAGDDPLVRQLTPYSRDHRGGSFASGVDAARLAARPTTTYLYLWGETGFRVARSN